MWGKRTLSKGLQDYTKKAGAAAVLAIRTLISSVLLGHICLCFGLCNSLEGNICGHSYKGEL